MREREQEQKRLNNKGFSLVELIVVIAIMAVLVGIVGTQVLPYIQKSKEAKDNQVVGDVLTAAQTAFSENTEDLKDPATTTYTIKCGTADTPSGATLSDLGKIVKDIEKLCGCNATNKTVVSAVKSRMKSTEGGTLAGIKITYTNNDINVQFYSDAGCTAGKEILRPAENQ